MENRKSKKTAKVGPHHYNSAVAFEKSDRMNRSLDFKFSRLPRKSIADEVSLKKKAIPAPNAY